MVNYVIIRTMTTAMQLEMWQKATAVALKVALLWLLELCLRVELVELPHYQEPVLSH